MGKKGRKAGKKNNKKAHKEKISERRNRVEEEQSKSIECNEEVKRPPQLISKADRVWFWDDNTSQYEDYNTYRCIVKDISTVAGGKRPYVFHTSNFCSRRY